MKELTSDMLKKCPFCGSGKVSVYPLDNCAKYDENGEYIHSYWSVGCDEGDCEASGPVRDTKLEAERAWDSRV